MAKSQKNQVPNVKREKYTTSLKVQLTPEQIADRAHRAAGKLNERDEKEDELKAHAKHAKGVIEQIEAEMRQLSGEVYRGTSYAPVDCERVYDYAAGTLTETRLDTSAVVLSRKLNAGEMQRELPFKDADDDSGDAA
jgi:hypothetical protein